MLLKLHNLLFVLILHVRLVDMNLGNLSSFHHAFCASLPQGALFASHLLAQADSDVP